MKTLLLTFALFTFNQVYGQHYSIINAANWGQSLALLDNFCKNCLPLFGTFQDAMHTVEWSLYHSRLSFSLNTKMISPHEVIQSAVNTWETGREKIGLNQVEGFIRQILG